MATSPLLGGTPAPAQPKGTDADALGPSDSSDSGSDIQHERRMPTGPDDPDEFGAVPAEHGSDTDRFGTGERASATPGRDRDAADIAPDRVSRSPDPEDIDATIDVEDLASGDDPSLGPDAEHADDEDGERRP
jgi:hypothetical protein